MKRRLPAICLALLSCAGLFAAANSAKWSAPVETAQAAESRKDLTFAVVPQQSASRLAQEWGPLFAALSEKTGLGVRFVTTKDIPTFEACLDKGVFDIAYMNPYHYVVFSGEDGYDAIAHQAEKKLKGMMVVHAESDISDVSGLDGSEIAFPSPGAFGASVLPRAELQSRGIAFEPRYVRSHDSVYRAVAGGFAAAGGGVTRTFNAAPDDLRAQLRVIYTTDGYTPHAIAVRSGMDAATVEQLREALVGLKNTNAETLSVLGISAFVAADDAAWDDVRALGLKPEQAGLDRLDEIACPFD